MPSRAAKPPEGKEERRRRPRVAPASPASGEIGEALGLPAFSADTLPPELRKALARLIGERDRLRDDLAKARTRIHTLERLADEDSLTPVANRRAFVRQLTRMIAFSNRYGVPASLVYFDINNMKQINDEHGHPAGDAALRHLATVLRENIRSSDVVGRLGGDEFGVILAQTDEAQAHDKAAALAEAIKQKPLLWGELTIPVTAAYGIHAFAGREKPQHAIEEADRAMYEHKRAVHAPERA